MLNSLTAPEQHRLLEAMNAIVEILGVRSRTDTSYVLCAHEHGDMGWVVHRRGALYFQEYGWNEEFEASSPRLWRTSYATLIRNASGVGLRRKTGHRRIGLSRAALGDGCETAFTPR